MTELMPPSWIWALVVFWGALWGSFANVVIARLPEGQSVVWPSSHCFSCDVPIRWYDNLPLVSWFFLRGRCRACDAPISIRYPLVEFAGVLCSVAAAWAVAGGATMWRLVDTPPVQILAAWMLLTFFFLILVMLTLIDLKHLLLPHRLTITLTILAFAYAWIVPAGGDWRGFVPSLNVRDAAIGFVVAYGSLFLFAMIYGIVRGRQGMGGGDFMLFGALGAWFGIEALPMLMLLAALQGVLLYAAALLFFPSLIHEVHPEDDAFWEGRVGDASSAAEEIRLAEAPADAPREAPLPSEVPHDAEITLSETAARGVAFGPFLCLAAAEFVAFGGMYLRWLHGGI